MAAVDLAVQRLKLEEGFRSKVYRDTVGKQTIGYGLNLDAGISERLASFILSFLVREIEEQLLTYRWYSGLDDVRRAVILDVAFNCGVDGLLHFPKMISALLAKNWTAASQELLDSDAARLNSSRYRALSQALLKGQP